MLYRLECGLQSSMFTDDWSMLHGHFFQRVWKFLSTFQTNYIGFTAYCKRARSILMPTPKKKIYDGSEKLDHFYTSKKRLNSDSYKIQILCLIDATCGKKMPKGA